MTPGLTPHLRFAAAAMAAVIATLVIAGAAAADERRTAGDRQVATGVAAGAPIDRAHAQALKQLYLNCEEAASRGALDGGAAMSCSVVYETLKHRVFGGDFDALHAWWRETRDRAAR